MDFLKLSGIGRKEGEEFVVRDVSFSQSPLQKLAIAGSTGSGKTTVLKIIAGLLDPTEGEVFFQGKKIKAPSEKLIPGHQGIAYLSQHFELLQHYRVEEVLEKQNRLEDKKMQLFCEVCRISHLLKRKTNQLSGGERQRIALTISLLSAPELLLLDEPFSNLDAFHRNILKAVINDLGTETNTSCILVSHDAADLLPWAEDIILLQQGRMIQQGSPQDIYFRPVNEYAAALTGSYTMVTPELSRIFSPYLSKELIPGQILRPSQFILVEKSSGPEASVAEVNFMGNYYEVALKISNRDIILHAPHAPEITSTCFVSIRN